MATIKLTHAMVPVVRVMKMVDPVVHSSTMVTPDMTTTYSSSTISMSKSKWPLRRNTQDARLHR